MINVIIGKNCSLTLHLEKKLRNCIVFSARDHDLIEKIKKLKKEKKINLIFNNFYPSRKIHELKSKDYNDFINLNLLSTVNILNNINPKMINKIIYSSSASVYGFDKYEMRDSSNRKLASAFKIATENIVYNYCEQNKVSLNILRIFNLYTGVNDRFSILGKIYNSIHSKKKLIVNNNGNSIRDFIHINDVVQIISKLLLKKTNTVLFDIGSGYGVKINEILNYINYPKKLIKFNNSKEEIDSSIANPNNILSELNYKNSIKIEKFLDKEFKLKNKKTKKINKIEYRSSFTSNENEYIIYGAGNAGKQIYHQLIQNNEKVYCFIDDNPKLHNKYYKSKKITSLKNIEKISLKKQINSIIISITAVDKNKLERLKNRLKKICSNVLYLPTHKELISDTLSLNDTYSLGIEEIIGRRELHLNKINPNIKNKVILVTGAAGSIGSELCRQIEFLNAKKVVALDNSEISLFNLKKNGLKKTKFVLGDIKDKQLVNKLIKENNIDHIFHAAAYKHLNILEENIHSAISNNVIGTYNLLENAVYNSCNFTLISTDKAVNPSSILGLTKRFCELICVFFRKFNKSIDINIVRFGNVFGSVGSAVPTFIEQINTNKTITITDKKVSRYFMTIKEACFLVLETSKIKKQNQTFVLNMGKPIKIIKIIKYLINLKKRLNPQSHYNIKEIGLQKGEKITEELYINKNELRKINKNIFSIDEKNYSNYDFNLILNEIKKNLDQDSANKSINLIKKILIKEI